LSLARAASIDDLRRMARRRVPRFVFDFFDGAAETEAGMARNRDAFARLLLVPRLMRNVEARDLGVDLFGRRWGAPLGIAPTGLTGLIWPGADLHKARTAARLNLPFLLSTASSHTIEEVAALAPGQAWFQLYAMRDMEIVGDLLRRARAAGIEVLVVTVDLPVHGKRERDIRNGFVLPLRLTPANLLEFLRCPRWSLTTLRAGPPRYANFEPYFKADRMRSMSRTAFIASQAGGSFDLSSLDRLRAMWPGKLVVKGLIAPADVAEMAARGIDGVIVSNHGGRQFDAGPAPIEMIPAAVEAAGGRLEVMLDSGIRRGADVVRARILGASFAFVGRAPLYGLAAGRGQPGTDKAMDILVDEIDRAVAMLGCTGLDQLGRDHLIEAGVARP
jgi:(S)-mandelate dehydrogenase